MNLKNKKFLELAISTLFFLSLFFSLNYTVNEKYSRKKLFDAKFNELVSLNLNNGLNQSLLDDYIRFYYHGKDKAEVISYFEQLKIPESAQKRVKKLNKALLTELTYQFLLFVIYFVVILFILYHLIERFAWLRFFLRRNYLYSHSRENFYRSYKLIKNKDYKTAIILFAKILLLIFFKYTAYFVLLSPSFIIAYMFRFSILTDNLLVFVLLVVFTNGILWAYLDKYYQMIENEINKDYVILAKVKGLEAQFEMKLADIFSLLFSKRVGFKGHVLHHVYLNLKKTQLKNLKELSVFLISSMLITEMSLNIQEHFSYELLKQLLNQNFHIVILMIFMIYLLIKMTEIITDYFFVKRYMIRKKQFETS